ncbi:MAG TPA: hypothetical protein VIF60_10125, partial [Burkholderiaceae bacterium]
EQYLCRKALTVLIVATKLADTWKYILAASKKLHHNFGMQCPQIERTKISLPKIRRIHDSAIGEFRLDAGAVVQNEGN